MLKEFPIVDIEFKIVRLGELRVEKDLRTNHREQRSDYCLLRLFPFNQYQRNESNNSDPINKNDSKIMNSSTPSDQEKRL